MRYGLYYISKENGSVKTGHCTSCTAGYVSDHVFHVYSLGHVCSHVTALLFIIEAASRLGSQDRHELLHVSGTAISKQD